MTKPIDTIYQALQHKFPLEQINDQKLQFRPSEAVTVEITHSFHAIQIVRNTQPVATFYKVATG
ncbi:hypothetical protein [Spirosoma pollinicola]|uniref:Uncharacterized protein n=1 Tax=Spirosoma pollinicola TaxID=2057025 RepID=A0A2K8Z644_9BACT|nr:hypothetical protein [Spirosoma pollinicola]AUD05345.1 hypothetical protein CWM47_27930 [Spirosoma pollinicola]